MAFVVALFVYSNLEDGLVSMMIEYMDGGSLQDIVDQGGCDDESTLANIAVQALKGLNFLHSCNQLHRDLKPANFLISHRGEVKVADLGIMKQLTVEPGKPGLPRTNTFVGTAAYMSPERITGKEYSFPSDVWALGLSIVSLALGQLLIKTQGGYWTIVHSIRDDPAPSLPDSFSPEIRDFCNQCLKKNPDERMTCKQLLQHPFLKKAMPEDLSLDQDYERGKKELLSTIRAMYTHSKNMKEDVHQRYKSQEEYHEKSTAAHEKIFGNIWESSAIDILKRMLFGDEGRDTKRFTRPRLSVLSKQLHMSMDKVIADARACVEELIKEDAAQGTPACNSDDVPPPSAEAEETSFTATMQVSESVDSLLPQNMNNGAAATLVNS